MQGQFTFASELPTIVPSDVHLVQSMQYFGTPFGMVPLSRKLQPVPSVTAAAASKAEEKKSKVSQRRAEQNRQAQKSFRERKVKYVQELEDRLQEATKQSMEADLLRMENTELRSLVNSLQTENSKLKQKISRPDFNFIPEIKAEFLTKLNETTTTTSGVSSAYESNNQKVETVFESQSTPECSSPDNNTPSSFSPPSNRVVESESPSSNIISESTSSPSNIASPSNYITSPSNFTSPESSSGLVSIDTSAPETEIINEILGFSQDKSLPSLLDQESEVILPESVEEWSLFIEESHKRDLDEANLYLSSIGRQPFVFSKNEYALKDHEQDELCDMFKKVQCKDKNPELCQGSKYMKSSD